MTNATDERLARQADLRSQVNEKLLKALIALLAVKDEHLLEELCVIFDHVRQNGGEIGEGPPEVWRGVDRQMGVLMDMAHGENLEQIEAEAALRH
ncbi:hypothetical protein [Caulobacter soli]|uniref:hypothetical protein n=1 Tax=Caulobacter soli TaxID=2708539 RepID=UPI0013EAF960|nr:hypothetical protein [Caulobacter soli]